MKMYCNCKEGDKNKTTSNFRLVEVNDEKECLDCGYYALKFRPSPYNKIQSKNKGRVVK